MDEAEGIYEAMEPSTPHGDADRSLAEMRVETAAQSRRSRAFDREAEAANSNFTGLLVRFAERYSELAFRLEGHGQFRGRIATVCSDAVHIELAGTSGVLLARIDAITSVTSTGQQALSAALDGPIQRTFGDALMEWEGSSVSALLAGGETVAGVLTTVGVDVCTIAHERHAGFSYVQVPKIAALRTNRSPCPPSLPSRASQGRSDTSR